MAEPENQDLVIKSHPLIQPLTCAPAWPFPLTSSALPSSVFQRTSRPSLSPVYTVFESTRDMAVIGLLCPITTISSPLPVRLSRKLMLPERDTEISLSPEPLKEEIYDYYQMAQKMFDCINKCHSVCISYSYYLVGTVQKTYLFQRQASCWSATSFPMSNVRTTFRVSMSQT